MYCVKCGVKLADTERQCPLCGTAAFHPEIERTPVPPLYPQKSYPLRQVSPKGILMALTVFCLLAFFITLLCDLRISDGVTWSGYVMGALVVGYTALLLPRWFHRPNPVIFVPCTFGVIAVYLLYINWAVDGSWFLPFAFPVTGAIGLIVTAVVALMRYVPRGKLYILGGASLATGGFMVLLEFLICLTFPNQQFHGWSWYPLAFLTLLGLFLLFLAIHRPTREMMARKFFL